jgi:hypothetical protein
VLRDFTGDCEVREDGAFICLRVTGIDFGLPATGQIKNCEVNASGQLFDIEQSVRV